MHKKLTVPLLLICLTSTSAYAQIDFNRDVRPILSDKCNFCHGPDASNREADLRLDERASAIDAIESGELLERINSTDEDYQMPPPYAKLTLTESERELIDHWIQQGAQYDDHWAFKLLPMSVSVPTVKDPNWPTQTLDRFVLAKLEQSGLNPTIAAPHWRWFRRASMDLTGLPPDSRAMSEFLTQVSRDEQAAYEQAVDRLLDSPAFGERLATKWLDLARYADSYGYQSDKLNTQWPYRDWVVQAFNENLPYDQFLTWQLAGDLLENPTEDQILATAFNRIHRLNNEGGAVFEEWRIENVADRVHTFGTAVLGLTLECCRCHDHKYDPISMRDYYSLSAYFNSIDESGVYDRTQKVPCPSILLPTPEQKIALEAAKAEVARLEAEYRKVRVDGLQRFEAWQKTENHESSIPDLVVALSFDRPFVNDLKELYHPSEGDRGWATMPELVPVENSKFTRLDAVTAGDAGEEHLELPRMALPLDGERGVTVEGVEPLDRWTPFSVVITYRETKRVAERSLIAHHTRGTDCGYNGWDLTIEKGHVESRMARVWPGNAMSVRTVEPIPFGEWQQLAATYDGSSRASGLRLFLNGVQLETVVVRDSVKKSANVKVDHGGQFVVGQRFRARGLDGGLIDDVRLYERDLTAAELNTLAFGVELEPTSDYYLSAIDEPSRLAIGELEAARQALVMAEEVMNEVPIMEEMSKPRETHLLARGQYDAETGEDTEVEREIPGLFSLRPPADAPRDRLGLAYWVTDPQHPLTGRVAVNHLWSLFFADALVRTPENFGLQGEIPTHPELLDWLARDFISSDWNVKRFCRNIVLSATYRQDSRQDARGQEIDPENRLLARGPSHRYSAEQLRDLALFASGLLDTSRGGPPVSPYQPGEDLWKEANGMSPPYQQSVGEALYRRSLYSVWKRTVPLPNMMAFDSTTREVCTVSRSRTNTPLQALVLLNDVQFVEASRCLAENSINRDDVSLGIRAAFSKCAGRSPTDEELEPLRNLYAEELKYFEENSAEAEALLQVGDSAGNDTVAAAQRAAMTTVCQVILNLDATVWKR